MKLEILSKRILLSAVIFSGSAFLIALFFYLIPEGFDLAVNRQAKNDLAAPLENAIAVSASEKSNFGLPARLEIPNINVDASIEYVGITPEGEMGVPKGPVNAAWFNLGPRPGEIGSAVIAGHYGWKDNKDSVFDNLHKLVKGDKIYIEDDQGWTISFVVRESRSYDPKADSSNVFFSSDGKSHLNLVTCEGVWDGVSKSYSKRLVVFADKE